MKTQIFPVHYEKQTPGGRVLPGSVTKVSIRGRSMFCANYTDDIGAPLSRFCYSMSEADKVMALKGFKRALSL